MKGIVHPLAEELGNLVEDDEQGSGANGSADRDSSWIWMIGIVVAIGLFAWVTR